MPKYKATIGADIRAYETIRFEAPNDEAAIEEAKNSFFKMRSNGEFVGGEEDDYSHPLRPSIVSLHTDEVKFEDERDVAEGIDFFADDEEILACAAPKLAGAIEELLSCFADAPAVKNPGQIEAIRNAKEVLVLSLVGQEDWDAHLIAKYERWQASNNLKLGAAEEHLADESLQEYQRNWLRNFHDTWKKVEKLVAA